VAGGKDESVSQPLWTPKNELLFISDRTGWWNIYREVNGKVIYLLLLLLLLTPLGTGQSLCHQGLQCYQVYIGWHGAWSAKQTSRILRC